MRSSSNRPITDLSDGKVFTFGYDTRLDAKPTSSPSAFAGTLASLDKSFLEQIKRKPVGK